MEELANLPKTVKVAIFDLRRRQALWVLNKARGEEKRNGGIIPAKREAWGLAGGGVEDGETDIEAAKREASEETGLWIKLDEYDLKLPPENHDDRHIVIVFATSKFQGEINGRPNKEIKQVAWFPINQPPQNRYSGDNRRYWQIVKLLRAKEALH